MQISTKKISLTLPEKLIDELDELSKELSYSKSFVVRLAIEEFIKHEKGGGRKK